MTGEVEIAGRYTRRSTLGSGVGTVVYEAFDRLIERRVAVKVVTLPPNDDPESADAIARFRRGAKAAGGLSHPNIVSVFDYGEDANQAWIVMELVEGGSLKTLLDRGERLSIPTIVQLMTQLLDALAYSHAKGVIHRDIKPANIMLTPSKMVKITDFGIARIENSALTHVGTMMGTPAYMAPEQLRGETVDLRADLWAAGVVLYQLITGEKPFGGGITSIMQKALYTEPVPPSRVRASTGAAEFDAVVARAMAKAPADRFASAAEFSAALRLAAAETAPPPPPPPPLRPALPPDVTVMANRPSRLPQRAPIPRQRTDRGWLKRAAGLAVLLFCLVAAGTWLLVPEPPPEPPPLAQADATPSGPSAELPAVASPPPRQPELAPPRASQGAAAPPIAPATPAVPVSDLGTVAAAIRGAPCSLLKVTLGNAAMAVSGVARISEADAIARTIEAFGIPAAAAQLSLETFDGPYCEALSTVRPMAALGEDPPAVTLLSPNPLRSGQALRFSVSTPGWAARLHVVYVSETGEVGHLVQGGPPYPPNSAVPFGDGTRWAATAPFGTDLLIVVASERPLFPQRRRRERLEEFSPALQAALREVQEGGRVAVRVALVETVAAP